MNNQQAINLLKGLGKSLDDYCGLNDEGKTAFDMAITALELFGNSEPLQSAQPEQIARDIATIIENERDMRVILKNERTETHSCDYQRTETHDLVSRRAALEAMDTWDKFGCDPNGKLVRYDDDKHYIPYVHYEDMVHTIKNLPSVHSPRWIPVSEALPEDLEAVNITWVNHEPEPYYHDIKDKNFVATGIHYRDKWYWYSTTCADFLGEYGSNEVEEVDDAVEIIAWMPLPEPYKEEEDE